MLMGPDPYGNFEDAMEYVRSRPASLFLLSHSDTAHSRRPPCNLTLYLKHTRELTHENVACGLGIRALDD